MVSQEGQTLAQREDLAKLRADVESREQDVKRLEAKAKATEGTKARSFVGEGDRQYLTGLKIGGQHILIAFDTSASMLDDTIVNVIRRRNMSDAAKLDAPKWRRVVRTVEWLTAQLPLDSQFQIYGFSETPRAMVDGTEGHWIDVANAKDLERAMEGVKTVVPTGGTSLLNLATAAADTVTGARQHLSRSPTACQRSAKRPVTARRSTGTNASSCFTMRPSISRRRRRST